MRRLVTATILVGATMGGAPTTPRHNHSASNTSRHEVMAPLSTSSLFAPMPMGSRAQSTRLASSCGPRRWHPTNARWCWWRMATCGWSTCRSHGRCAR